MKKARVIIITLLFIILLSGCSERSDSTAAFHVIGNRVTIREDSAGAKNIVVAVEVSNLTNSSLYFRESDFDNVDES